MIYADLHAHTTASDGTATPTELAQTAKKVGLTYLALTDHDTTAGVEEAGRVARTLGIRFLPGVELTTQGAPGKCDLLGLGIDSLHQELNETLADISEKRRVRNEAIAARLRALHIPATLEAVTASAPPGANVGRPHFAQWLVAQGHVRNFQEAFDRYLASGKAANIERESLTPEQAIQLIHAAGGLCFLAHPGLVRLDQQEKIEQRIAALLALGMDGIEAYHPAHSVADSEKFRRIAEKENILITGGSDFHGANKPDIALGYSTGNALLSAALLPERLLERAI